MREIKGSPGEHVSDVCIRIAENAPAFTVFNDIRIVALGGETAGDLIAAWEAESERRRTEYLASDRYKKEQEESKRRAAKEKLTRDATLALIESTGARQLFPWQDGMREISGFGGGYESACRDMVYAGLVWLKNHPGAVLQEGTADAKALREALLSACPDCSGAMFGATMSSCVYIAKNGWVKYVEEMSK